MKTLVVILAVISSLNWFQVDACSCLSSRRRLPSETSSQSSENDYVGKQQKFGDDVYIFNGQLGAGGYGAVAMATNVRLMMPFALKAGHVLDEHNMHAHLRKTFPHKNNAEIDAEFRKNHVLPETCFCPQEIVPFLSKIKKYDVFITPYCVGQLGTAIETSSTKIQLESGETVINRQAMPAAAIFRMAEELLTAVTFIHSRGGLHRDVSLANIFLDLDNFKLMLGDLGAGVLKVEGTNEFPKNKHEILPGIAIFYGAKTLKEHKNDYSMDLHPIFAFMCKAMKLVLPWTTILLDDADTEQEEYQARIKWQKEIYETMTDENFNINDEYNKVKEQFGSYYDEVFHAAVEFRNHIDSSNPPHEDLFRIIREGRRKHSENLYNIPYPWP